MKNRNKKEIKVFRFKITLLKIDTNINNFLFNLKELFCRVEILNYLTRTYLIV